MEFRINIFISFFVHATILTAALALPGKDVVVRFPERFTLVTLFDEPAVQKTAASGTEKKKEPVITAGKQLTRLREASPPEAPPATHSHDKEQPAAIAQKNNPLEDSTGLKDTSRAEVSGAALQAGGIPGHFPGVMQLAVQGKAATQNGRGGGGNKTAPGDSDVVNTIRAAIERAKNYPPLARKRGIEGTATTEFVINEKGYPEDVRIVHSSGSDILDAAAKNTVLRASPYPPVRGGIEVPITFRIEKGR